MGTSLSRQLSLILLFCTLVVNAVAQEADTSITTSKVLGEMLIVAPTPKRIGGISSGKIIFNPNLANTLPSILGAANLLKMLEFTPSVKTTGDGNSNIYVRGGDAGQNLLLYAESPIYTQGHLLNVFPLFNADHVASLELLKGGIPAEYGGRLSSVINVQSKHLLPEKFGICGSVGLLASQATVKIPIGEKFGVYISGRKTYVNLIMQPFLNATINRKAKFIVEDAGYDFYDGNITLLGRLSPNSVVGVDAFFSTDKLYIGEEASLINGAMRWRNTVLSAHWDYDINPRNTLKQGLFFSRYNNSIDMMQAEAGMNVFAEVMDWGYKNLYSFFIKDIPFESGVQYSSHYITPRRLKVVNDGSELYTGLQNVYHSQEASLFISSHWRFLPMFFADVGLRYNLFLHTGPFEEYNAENANTTSYAANEIVKAYGSLDPRLSVCYEISATQLVRASYNRQNQYINLLTPSSIGIPTDFWASATTNIMPQQADDFSMGYFYALKNGAADFSVETYYRTMDGVAEYNEGFIGSYDADFSKKINFGKGRAYGIEFIAKKNTGKISGWISYALGRTERTFEAINNGQTFPAKYDRRHDLSIVCSYTLSRQWEASVLYTYATGNAYTLPSSWYFINNNPVKQYGDYNGARMPDYNRTDLSVNFKLSKSSTFNFSVYNVFMVQNPIYIFLSVKQDPESKTLYVEVKQKNIYSIIPSLSWKFNF